MAPEFSCEGTSGRTRHLSHYLGRAVIIVYEDRDSNHQNDVLKQELAARARAQDLTQDVSVVPVANLSGFAFWPAQGFARDAVLDIARQQQMEILIDWTGEMARSYRFRPAMSYVMVLSREGRVLFRHAGTLDSSARGRFFNAVSEAIATR
jgi:predicted transcriptional regulator